MLPSRRSFYPRALLPGALVLILAPLTGAQEDTDRWIGPGVKLIRRTLEGGPHSLHVVEADTSEPFIRLGVSLGRGETLGLEPLSRQAERLTRPERYAIAGVNGDYFYYPNGQQPGIPTSAAVLNGEL